MTNEILIGICGLVLTVLAYFAGVWRTERRHAIEDRGARIRSVFDSYMGFRRISRTSGLDGLQKSGISTLKSNEEIQELLELIVNHGESNPLGANHEQVFNVKIRVRHELAVGTKLFVLLAANLSVMCKNQYGKRIYNF